VVENVGFSSNVPDVPVAGTAKLVEQAQDVLRGQPGLLKTVGLGAIALLVLLMVVRPLTRQMVTAMSVPMEPRLMSASSSAATEREERALGPGVTMESGAPVGGQLRAVSTTTPPVSVFEQVSQQIRKEPAQSRRLLESWISEPVEEGTN